MKPFIFINIAASADGKISDEGRRQIKISCREDMNRVDKLRASSDAIMVGIGTVLSDNPELTVKSEELRKQRVKEGKQANPLRIVVDSKCRTPFDARILNDEAKTVIAVSEITKSDSKKLERIKEKADVLICGREKVNLKELVEKLYDNGIRKIMVEGGGTLNYGLIREGLVDEISIYYGDKIIGGTKSPTIVDGNSFAIPVNLKLVEVERLGRGVVVRWQIVYQINFTKRKHY
jgi:2,5-diamino-6-(ribosylamino)-4(3H)-pyrimidinone 5'-phosphate reductase